MKKLIPVQLRCLVGLWCVAALAPAWTQDPGTRVTPELLQTRIAATQDSAELEEATKSRLIDLYRQSLSNLEARSIHEESAEQYRRSRLSAPTETEKTRAALEQRRASDPSADLESLSSSSLDRLTVQLDTEIANLTAVEAKLAVLEARLSNAARRPAEARARIAEARSLTEDLASTSEDRAALSKTPRVAEATRWAVQTRIEALRTEITMLDEELLSHNAHTELMKAERDQAAYGADRISQRVDVLREAVGERRRIEAELAMTQAQAALEGASSGESLVRELAESNLALVELLREQLEELDELAVRERNRSRTSQIESAYRSARRKLELVGSRAPVGMAILAQRSQFPSAKAYATERRILSRSITRVSLRLTEAEEERPMLSDVGAYVDRRIADAGEEALDSNVRGELENLVSTRRSLLDRAIANDVALQRRLYDLDTALRHLTDRMSEYDEFLARRLLWARSTRPIGAEALSRIPGEVAGYLAPGPWLEAARKAAVGLVRAPAYSLIMLLAVGLVWRRGQLRVSLEESGRSVGGVQEDSMKSTFKALGYTLLLAAPAPLALGAIGGAMSAAGETATFPSAVGSALVRASAWLVLPVVVRAASLPGGFANRHFGWDEGALTELRRQLAWFIAFILPVYFVLRTSLVVEPPVYSGGTLTFLCFVASNMGLFALIVAIGHPTRGSARRFLASRSGGSRSRWRHVGFPLVALLPVATVALAWFGYAYTAQELMRRFFQTIWALVAIWLGAALVYRWLLLTGRRLTHQESLDSRGDAPTEPAESREGHDGEIGELEVDLVALNADTSKLLNAIVLLTVALALVGIWGGVIPALGVLEDADLWNRTALIDGEQHTVPVTLLDLLLAAVVGIVGYVLARNVPSLLDIILLRHGSVSAGGRYTAGTLTRYTITALTILIVLERLGASTSQLGWAAAALGVGIGFGLQEIVANFICGLILLFERPVRVGDVVTIGDASGVVSRIRIRATTIRDWERKELIVPNKELITGRLLNWTLSNAMTRIVITVGVAYGSDVEKAMGLIREAAAESTLVLDDPEPHVHFEQFGDSSLNLTLRAFIGDVTERLPATTELHNAIDQKFRAAGVVIAFPQRDLHVYSGGGATAPPIGGGTEGE